MGETDLEQAGGSWKNALSWEHVAEQLKAEHETVREPGAILQRWTKSLQTEEQRSWMQSQVTIYNAAAKVEREVEARKEREVEARKPLEWCAAGGHIQLYKRDEYTDSPQPSGTCGVCKAV